MKNILIILFLILSVSSKANENQEIYQQAREKINYIRDNFSDSDVTDEIYELNQFVKENNIELARFGLGRGVIPFWRTTSSKELVEILQTSPISSETSYISSTDLDQTDSYLVQYQVHGDIDVSVVSEIQAQKLFQSVYSMSAKLTSQEYGNRCESRAHMISRLMDTMGIKTAKVFIESEVIAIKDHSWGWYYHVAPIVLVQTQDGLLPYIFDHSIFDKAVPLSEWINFLRERYPENIYRVFATKRFNLLPGDRLKRLDDYLEEDLDEVDSRLLKGRLLSIIRPFMKPL